MGSPAAKLSAVGRSQARLEAQQQLWELSAVLAHTRQRLSCPNRPSQQASGPVVHKRLCQQAAHYPPGITAGLTSRNGPPARTGVAGGGVTSPRQVKVPATLPQWLPMK